MAKVFRKAKFRKFPRGFHTVKDWEYYLTAWHGRSRFKKAKELLELESIDRILDIGCGDGFFLKTVATKADKYSVDIIDVKKSKDYIYTKADLEEGLPYKDGVFDALFAGEIIEHLFDTDNFVRECYRILINDGFIVLTTPNLCSLKNLFLMLLGRQPIAVDFSLEEGVGHIRAFSPIAIRRLLKKAGFKIECLHTDRLPIPFAPANNFFLKIEQKLGEFFSRWGNILIVKARKY